MEPGITMPPEVDLFGIAAAGKQATNNADTAVAKENAVVVAKVEADSLFKNAEASPIFMVVVPY